jgi:hypothetical protein
MSDYIYCPSCGKQVNADNSYCEYCGTSLVGVVREGRNKYGNTASDVQENAGASILERAYISLDENDWRSADMFCEQYLDYNPRSAEAYMLKLFASFRVHSLEELSKAGYAFSDNINYQRAYRFADQDTKDKLKECADDVPYFKAAALETAAADEIEFLQAAREFDKLAGHRDALLRAEECRNKAEEYRKEKVYREGTTQMSLNTIPGYLNAVSRLEAITGYRNTDELIVQCNEKLSMLRQKEEEERQERERKKKEEEERKQAEKKKKQKIALIVLIFFAVAGAIAYVLINFVIPKIKYNKAHALLETGDYDQAYELLEELGYRKEVTDSKYERGLQCLEERDYDLGYKLLDEANARGVIDTNKYERAIGYIEEKNYRDALDLLNGINPGTTSEEYPDGVEGLKSVEEISEFCTYGIAIEDYENKDYLKAAQAFEELKDYQESKKYRDKAIDEIAKNAFVVSNNSLSTESKEILSFLFELRNDEHVQKIISKKGNDAYYALGIYAYTKGNKTVAVEYLEKCTSKEAKAYYESIKYPISFTDAMIDTLLSNYKGVWLVNGDTSRYVQVAKGSRWTFTFGYTNGSSSTDIYTIQGISQTNKTTYTASTNNGQFTIINEKENDNKFSVKRNGQSSSTEYKFYTKTLEEALNKLNKGPGWYIVTASPNLRIRSGPGTEYSILGKVNKNEQIYVEEVMNGWGKIYYSNESSYGYGWVSLEYADKI